MLLFGTIIHREQREGLIRGKILKVFFFKSKLQSIILIIYIVPINSLSAKTVLCQNAQHILRLS